MPAPIPRDEGEQVHAETIAARQAWLTANRARPDGVWLVSWKGTTGRPRLTYEESVEEALAFGWIDSKGRTLDDERSMLWFSPRKPGSGWSRPNKDPGQAAGDASQADRRDRHAGRPRRTGQPAVAAARAVREPRSGKNRIVTKYAMP